MGVLEEIEQNLIKFPPEPAEEYLVKGATLQCDVNGGTSKLELPKEHNIRLPGGPQINKEDNKPNVNILPFGFCPILKAPCNPVIPKPWEEANEEQLVGELPAVRMTSFLVCDLGGLIQPLESGQSFVEQFLASKLREMGYYIDMLSPEKTESLLLGFAAALIENFKPQAEVIAEVFAALPGFFYKDPGYAARVSATLSSGLERLLFDIYTVAEYKDAFYLGKSLGDFATIAVGIWGAKAGMAAAIGGLLLTGAGGTVTVLTAGGSGVLTIPVALLGVGGIVVGSTASVSGAVAVVTGFGNSGKDWNNFKLAKSSGSGVRFEPDEHTEDLINRLRDTSTSGHDTKGRTVQWNRQGDYDQVLADFYSLEPVEVKSITIGDGSEGKIGLLKDGRTVIARSYSKEGHFTLEIQRGKNRVKFRYGDEY